MSDDQITTYPTGTRVWVKCINKVWWPGIVVDPETVPEELSSFLKTKKNSIAVVQFKTDMAYEVVINAEKICFYTCEKKMEFIKKGHALYLKQQKGGWVAFKMKSFIDDVLSMEKDIGGNLNIFEEFKESEPVNMKEIISIKEMFRTEKERKKKGLRKSLQPSSTIQKTPKFKVTSITPRSVRSNVIPVQLSGGYSCHIVSGCSFTTNRYDLLKRHMIGHKDDIAKPSTKVTSSNKTKSVKRPLSAVQKKNNIKNPKKQSVKKQVKKLRDELLEDWDDGDDINETQTTNFSEISQTTMPDSPEDVSFTSISSSPKKVSQASIFGSPEKDSLSTIFNSPGEVLQTTISEEILPAEISDFPEEITENTSPASPGSPELVKHTIIGSDSNPNNYDENELSSSIVNENKVDPGATQDSRYECMLSSLPTPDWLKEEDPAYVHKILEEAKLFVTVDKEFGNLLKYSDDDSIDTFRNRLMFNTLVPPAIYTPEVTNDLKDRSVITVRMRLKEENINENPMDLLCSTSKPSNGKPNIIADSIFVQRVE